jgi:hypothetical protein
MPNSRTSTQSHNIEVIHNLDKVRTVEKTLKGLKNVNGQIPRENPILKGFEIKSTVCEKLFGNKKI